jgi:2-amino-4-hydroxy-6-hydroxymethyldihydropteridine diphosphokinase
MRDIAYVAIGSNLGNRSAYLAIAREKLAQLPDSRLLAISEVQETEAIVSEPTRQPSYLNQMVAIETSLEPEELLNELQRIENEAGRVRSTRWAPRTLDLDIVLFGDTVLQSTRLIIPHPELPNREFWRNELEQIRMAK